MLTWESVQSLLTVFSCCSTLRMEVLSSEVVHNYSKACNLHYITVVCCRYGTTCTYLQQALHFTLHYCCVLQIWNYLYIFTAGLAIYITLLLCVADLELLVHIYSRPCNLHCITVVCCRYGTTCTYLQQALQFTLHYCCVLQIWNYLYIFTAGLALYITLLLCVADMELLVHIYSRFCTLHYITVVCCRVWN